MKNQGHKITAVAPGSIGEELELEPGDILLSIDGQEIEDIFDYDYMTDSESFVMLVRKADGEEWELEIESGGEDLGLTFENGLMSEYRSCRNKCIFCFIDQMPPGMRETLYFKDDDSRLSFLQGNYITMKNMKQADIDRIIDHASAAACLTRMLADVAADRGEGVIFADQANRIIITTCTHERDIARNIDAGRAERHAGNRMVPAEQAASVLHVRQVVLAEALHALKHHARRLVADGAVCCVLNDTRGLFDEVDGLRRGGRVQNAFQQLGQLTEADAARNTFAAGLRMAQAQERKRHIDRAQSRRTCADTSFYVTVKPLNNGFSASRCLD